MRRALIAFIFSGVIGFSIAQAQAQEFIANQGSPGSRGPWGVSPGRCNSVLRDGGNPDQVTSVGVTSTPVPATAAAVRVWVLVCNSLENTGTPKVKCLANGGTPVMGRANPGQVLGVGDCFQYTTQTAVNCIADTAATAVTSYECLP